MRRLLVLLTAVQFGVLGTVAQAALIQSSLGNTASGFTDGSVVPTFLIGGAQAGQPAPFDQGYGTDGLSGGNFSQTWTHAYGAITDTILSAEITFGIYDHDSAAAGSQLGLFDYDGNDLTGTLDGLFEASSSSSEVYNEYTLVLTDFAALADGTALFSLDLAGPGLVPILFGGGFAETSTNGGNLIFATLSITTQDPGTQPVPEPGSLLLLGAGLLGLSLRGRLRA